MANPITTASSQAQAPVALTKELRANFVKCYGKKIVDQALNSAPTTNIELTDACEKIRKNLEILDLTKAEFEKVYGHKKVSKVWTKHLHPGILSGNTPLGEEHRPILKLINDECQQERINTIENSLSPKERIELDKLYGKEVVDLAIKKLAASLSPGTSPHQTLKSLITLCRQLIKEKKLARKETGQPTATSSTQMQTPNNSPVAIQTLAISLSTTTLSTELGRSESPRRAASIPSNPQESLKNSPEIAPTQAGDKPAATSPAKPLESPRPSASANSLCLQPTESPRHPQVAISPSAVVVSTPIASIKPLESSRQPSMISSLSLQPTTNSSKSNPTQAPHHFVNLNPSKSAPAQAVQQKIPAPNPLFRMFKPKDFKAIITKNFEPFYGKAEVVRAIALIERSESSLPPKKRLLTGKRPLNVQDQIRLEQLLEKLCTSKEYIIIGPEDPQNFINEARRDLGRFFEKEIIDQAIQIKINQEAPLKNSQAILTGEKPISVENQRLLLQELYDICEYTFLRNKFEELSAKFGKEKVIPIWNEYYGDYTQGRITFEQFANEAVPLIDKELIQQAIVAKPQPKTSKAPDAKIIQKQKLEYSNYLISLMKKHGKLIVTKAETSTVPIGVIDGTDPLTDELKKRLIAKITSLTPRK